jgi:hypothetical protein
LRGDSPLQNTARFLNLSYRCPEPVLANIRLLLQKPQNGANTAFPYQPPWPIRAVPGMTLVVPISTS